MNARIAGSLAVVALGLVPAARAGEEMAHDAQKASPPSPILEKLKSLSGEWQGTAHPAGDGKAVPTVATIKVVSAGSAVMLVTDPGGPHEMVTLFHADDGPILATHYCAAMNQPRMKATPDSTPERMTFEFVDGTNLKTHPGRMQRLTVSASDPSRHTQEWVFLDRGKASTMVFEMTRKN
ncbi:MAG TPA: hypothetical protein VMT17_03105 [Anaeromyxobacteraceae bacterium]|nr:hypothetical protein [Anaeromyxobacteraceae bacterium]